MFGIQPNRQWSVPFLCPDGTFYRWEIERLRGFKLSLGGFLWSKMNQQTHFAMVMLLSYLGQLMKILR
jgi:hypothetical protein